MNAIIKRNCQIYFKNKTNLFFSLLGALIVFILYLFFLRKNTVSQVEGLENGVLLIDMWLLGGLLAVTALTTSFSVLGQLIEDKSTNKFMDFSISDTQPFAILVGYYFSAVIVSTLMQMVVFALCLGFFAMNESLLISVPLIIKMVGVMIISALCATSFNLVIASFIKRRATMNTIANMIGALSGFLCTAYIPIGSFSNLAKTVIQIFPMSYASSSFRRILMTPILADFPTEQAEILKENLGVGYQWHHQLSTAGFDLLFLGLTIVVCLVMIGLTSKKILKVSLN